MNIHRGVFLFLIPVLIFAQTAVSDVPKEKPKTLKLAHNLHQSHPVHLAFVYMQQQLHEISSGHMNIRIYPSSQMGDAVDTLQLLQIGALDLTKGSGSHLEPFEGSYALFNLPFLFEDETHFNAVVQGDIGREIMNSTRERGFFCIASYAAGYRSFYAKKPIRTPDDLRGMKVRVQVSPMNLEMVRLMGGSATPLDFGEVYTALQQGVVNAAENNEASWVDTRHIEVTPVFSETRHLALPDFLAVSSKSWNKLSSQQQEWLMKAASLSEQYQREKWSEAITQARARAIQSGAEIIPVNRKAFQETVMPLYDRFREKPKHRELLERTLQLGKT